jgi:hypothetical protein
MGSCSQRETGNALGILAGALEAAAAGAAGIGLAYGGQTQAELNAVATALGTAGIATSLASDFASGNLGQGLVDSLNLYLPAVAQAYVNYANNQGQVQQPLVMYAAASGNPAPSVDIPDFGSIVGQAISSPSGTGSGSSSGISVAVTPVSAGGLSSVGSAANTGGVGEVITQDGTTYSVQANSTTTSDTISPSQGLSFSSVLGFLSSVFGISSAEAATPGGVQATGATASPGVVTYANSDGSQDVRSGGSAAWRDNNPGNMIAGAGAYQPIGMNLNVPGTAAIFPDFQAGWNAMIANLQSPFYASLSVKDAINRWVGNGVPGSNPPAYVSNVVSWTGLSPDTVLNALTPTQLNDLGSAIMRQEGYTPGTVTHHAP